MPSHNRINDAVPGQYVAVHYQKYNSSRIRPVKLTQDKISCNVNPDQPLALNYPAMHTTAVIRILHLTQRLNLPQIMSTRPDDLSVGVLWFYVPQSSYISVSSFSNSWRRRLASAISSTSSSLNPPPKPSRLVSTVPGLAVLQTLQELRRAQLLHSAMF